MAAAASVVVVCIYSAARMAGWYSGRTSGNDGMSDSYGANNGYQKEGEGYNNYEGPLFPLTIEGDADALTAQRKVTFDFSSYLPQSGEGLTVGASVTDRYILENHSKQDVTVDAVYPFAAALTDGISVMPEITVDGEKREGDLRFGPVGYLYQSAYAENTELTDSWRDYQTLIESGYRERAFADFPHLDEQVTVYELTDMEAPDELGAGTLALDFSVDTKKTKLLGCGMNGWHWEENAGQCSVFVPHPGDSDYGRSSYLIVIGEDIRNYSLSGYTDGGCEPQSRTEQVTGRVVRRECTLEEIASEFWEQENADESAETWNETYDGEKTIKCTIESGTILGALEELLDTARIPEAGADTRFNMSKKIAFLMVWIWCLVSLGGCCGDEQYDEQYDEEPVMKPVIYLYPRETTDVTVRLGLRGRLTSAYPAYQDGWRVTARPDGTLTDATGREYYSLFWEGEMKASYDFSEGFELMIDPKPDTLIRVFMAWKPCSSKTKLPEQKLTASGRRGFTVVEWGGCEVKK